MRTVSVSGTGQATSKSKRKSRGKTTTYGIMYRDDLYVTCELTKSDYGLLKDALVDGRQYAVELSIGVIVLDQIRYVIEQRTIPQVEEKPANPPMTQDELGWLRQFAGQDEEEGE